MKIKGAKKKHELQYYDKKFIEDNFIDNNMIFNFKKFCSEFKISRQLANQHLKKLKINYKKIEKFYQLSNDKIINIYQNDDGTIKFNEIIEKFNIKREMIIKTFNNKNIKVVFNSQNTNNFSKYNDKHFIEENFIDNNLIFDLYKFSQFFNVSISNSHKKLRELDIKYKKLIQTSRAEREIIKLLDNEELIIGDREILEGKELDILIQDKKFAIEYNGLMFHSHGISEYNMFNNPIEDKKKHLNKTVICENKGIQLFHIFENEWVDPIKREIWKSMFNNKLGLNSRLGARKCTIQYIRSNDAKIFLENNHMQGNRYSKINIGLYYKQELVSLMTFSNHHKYEWDMIRFCTKINLNIQGAASRLLKFFEREFKPKEILSYANRRWSQGDLYQSLGFEHLHDSPPNYFYFEQNKINKLWSRNVFQKHKLEDKLSTFDNNLSETKNMYTNNYRKIFDCGNKVFIRKYNE